MRLVTAGEMNRLDAWARDVMGIPTLLLMENAGQAVAQKALEILKDVSSPQVIVLVGKGNNGGDALVAARQLAQGGAEIKLFLLSSPAGFQGAVLENWRLGEKMGLKHHQLKDEHSFYLLKLSLNQAHLVIDGMLGTGFKGRPGETIARTIQIVNDSSCPCLAVDIPSGLDADTGKTADSCIRADYTVTFAWAKRGLVLYPGRLSAGNWEVADISLPQLGLEILEKSEHYVDAALARRLLPSLDWEGHKNSYGHVLIIAGSPGMTGAAFLASKGALRAGAGMVTTCLPRSLAGSFDLALPEALTRGVAETADGTLALEAWPEIFSQAGGKKAVVFGPGLTNREEIREILEYVLTELNIPLVLDADGLNVLAQEPAILKNAPVPLVLTPHPGELGRLLGISSAAVQENRVERALEAASLFKVVVVLKGAATVTATPQGEVYINSTGSPALATAGTGDVLAGTVGALLAQGLSARDAAVLGVYLHGLAGDTVAAEIGQRGVIAGDIVEALPRARKRLAGE